MPSILTPVTFPTDDVRQQYSSVKAFLEEEFLGQGTLCVAESQLIWADGSNESNRQGVAIDYPMLTMHGIVTHDPKYPEEHLVVIVQKAKSDEDDDDDEENRSDSPVEYDAIETVNYRFVMSSNDDLKHSYQTIADCQALHPDPSDEMVEDDEVGSDIDYGNEDDDEQSNGNGDADPYGYAAHFASTNRPANNSHRPDQQENSDDVEQANGDESME